MITALRPLDAGDLAPAGLRRAGWEIHLASAGDATAEVIAAATSTDVIVSEGSGRAGTSRGAAPRRPWLQLRLAPTGETSTRCSHAPAVLLVRSPDNAAEPLLPCTDAPVRVDIDSLLLALSPSVLDALGPAEILAAPALLWLSPEPSLLLARWVDTATRHGLPGAAAATARRTGLVGGPVLSAVAGE